MKKLRLTLEALEVESFSTVVGEGTRGTVEGRASVGMYSDCCPRTVSEPVACLCMTHELEGTCETTCNNHQCHTCNGAWSCACETNAC